MRLDNDLIYNFIPIPGKEEVIYLDKEKSLSNHNHLELSKFKDLESQAKESLTGEIYYSAEILDKIYLDMAWKDLNIISGSEVKSLVRRNLSILSYSKINNLECLAKTEEDKNKTAEKDNIEDRRIAIKEILDSFDYNKRDHSEAIMGFAEGKMAYRGKLKFYAIDIKNNDENIEWIQLNENLTSKNTQNTDYFDSTNNTIRGCKFYHLKKAKQELGKGNSDYTQEKKIDEETTDQKGNIKLHGRIRFENLNRFELGLLIASIKPFDDAIEYFGYKNQSNLGQVRMDIRTVFIEEFEELENRLKRFEENLDLENIYIPKKKSIELGQDEIKKLKDDFVSVIDNKILKSSKTKLLDYENERMNAFYYSKTRFLNEETNQELLKELKDKSIKEIMKNEIKEYKELQEKFNQGDAKINTQMEFASIENEIFSNYRILLVSEQKTNERIIDALYEYRKPEIQSLDEVLRVLQADTSNYDIVIFSNYDEEKHQAIKSIMDDNKTTGFVYYNDKRVMFKLGTNNDAFNFANTIITLPGSVMSVAKFIYNLRKKPEEGENNE